MQLRDYQERALNEIQDHWKHGRKKVLLWLPTGSGKNVILSTLLEECHRGNTRAIFVVRGRELVSQGSRRLSCPHSVIMGSSDKIDERSGVFVASIDTLRSRKSYPRTDLLIIDEAHLATSDSFRELAEHYPLSRVLCCSATPYTTKPLTHLCEHLVCTIGITGLIEQGYLVPPRYFAPSRPDLTGVKRTGGDYSEKDLENVMLKRKIVADIVKTWKEKGENRPSLCFAVTVTHSKALEDEFLWSGVSVAHMDANTPDDERRAILEAHRTGQVKMIVNVGILHVGVDIPWLGTISVARPTLSLIWNDQALGRGTRPFPGKKDFIVLDHAGNIYYHGPITDERTPTLIGRENRKLPGDAAVRTCKECFAVFPISVTVCPECGESSVGLGSPRTVLTEQGRLVEVEAWELLPKEDQARRLKNQLVHIGMKKGWRPAFVFYLIKKQFGEELAGKVYPHRGASTLSRSHLDRIKPRSI